MFFNQDIFRENKMACLILKELIQFNLENIFTKSILLFDAFISNKFQAQKHRYLLWSYR